jgi:hypothetical protein
MAKFTEAMSSTWELLTLSSIAIISMDLGLVMFQLTVSTVIVCGVCGSGCIPVNLKDASRVTGMIIERRATEAHFVFVFSFTSKYIEAYSIMILSYNICE